VLTCEIARKEVILFVLMFIPGITIVASIIVQMELVKRFGKNKLFGMGLAFLKVIFYPIFDLGDAKNQGRRRRNRDDEDNDEFDDRPRNRQ
jgi:hypothetical protein